MMTQSNEERPWALARAPGASFRGVARQCAAQTFTPKDKASLQAFENELGPINEEYRNICDPEFWTARIEAAREIKDPKKMLEKMAGIEREKANIPDARAELDRAIVTVIRKMYPSAIKLLEAVIRRLDVEIGKIAVEEETVNAFWGLKKVESGNWLIWGIQRLKSGLESQLNSLRTNDSLQVSICRYVLSEAGVLEPRMDVPAP
jgi:hypothetical protein